MRRLLALSVVGLFVVLLAAANAAPKDDTKPASGNARELATLIDKHISERLKEESLTPSPRADDAEFLRRAYLDLTGTIPTASKASAFLDSKDADKREKLIDELLASKEYGTHFATIWRDLMLRPDANMIRPPDTQPLVDWMAEQFNKNSGWDKIVSDMLTAEGAKPEGLYSILNGNSRGYPQANVLAASTGQLFMGVQLACAECHNHPFVDKWKQEDFWGVAAFFGNVKTTAGAKGAARGIPGVTEGKGTVDKRRNEAPTMKGTAIVIPDSSFKLIGKSVEASYPHSKEKPKLDASKPFRPALAAWLTAKDNPYFAANAVNRMWAHLLGVGFANPVGEMSEVNPPSHPELLKVIAKEFVAQGFDQKFLIKAIMLSDTYQRTSKPTEGNKDDDRLFARQSVKVLTPEVLYTALTQALEVKSLSAKVGGGGGKKKNAPANAGDPKKQFIEFFTTKEVGGDATEFSHGIPQALRLMNHDLFNTGGNALERIIKAGGGTDKIVEGVYVTVLSRKPTTTEAKDMAAYVERQKDKTTGYRGVYWTLINSAEFMFNR